MNARRGVYTHDVVYSNNKWQWVFFLSQLLLVNKLIYRRLYLYRQKSYLFGNASDLDNLDNAFRSLGSVLQYVYP